MFLEKARSFFVYLGLLLSVIFVTSTEPKAEVFNPKHFKLNNGLQVILLESNRVPAVTHMIWYKVGSINEIPGETGIAHFLEHLMFKGTNLRKPGEFSKFISRNGGTENAFTSTDYTAYYQTISVKHLPSVMEMEADRMKNIHFTEQDVNTEKNVILEERRSRVDDNPSGLLSEQMAAALFLNHPYRNPVIGWEHEIKSLTAKKIKKFYSRWYAPNNAILVVAGDITEQKLKQLAEKYYGPIPQSNLPKNTSLNEPPHFASRRLILRDDQVRHPTWRRSYLAPSTHWGDRKLTYPLEILSDILGAGSSSYLYKKLVIEKKIATSAGTYYSGDGKGPGRFTIYASPSQNISIEKLEESIENELSYIKNTTFENSVVKRSINRMLASIIFARDSFSGSARSIGSAVASGLSIEDFESWPKNIRLVTSKEIRKAASIIFRKNQSVTGLLLPENKL